MAEPIWVVTQDKNIKLVSEFTYMKLSDDNYKIIGKDEYGNGMCLGAYPSYESVQLVLDNIIKTLSYYKDPLFRMP